MQSRYYNPEIGRFINADGLVSTGQGLLSNNMFAYCGNNPVMRQDLTGQSWNSIWNSVKKVLADTRDVLVKAKESAKTNKDVTVAKGVTGNAAFGPGASFSAGLTEDTKGNVGLMLTVNGGGGFPSAGVGAFASVNNAPTIYDQRGLGVVVGASGGSGTVSVGGEYNVMYDSENDCTYHGGTASVTAGFYPTIFEWHGEVGYTWVWGFNKYDVAIDIIDLVLSI